MKAAPRHFFKEFVLFSGLIIVNKLGEDKVDVSVYLTAPKYRGLGLGTKTWTAALEGLGPNCNISLTAVSDKVPLYSKMGFGIIGPKRKFFAGVPNRTSLLGKLSEDVGIEELKKGSIEELCGYDLHVSGVNRFPLVRRYFQACIRPILVASKSDQIVGYASLDKRADYHFIAPLYADNKGVAMALISRLIEDVSTQEPIAMDVPDDNQDARELREDLGIHEAVSGYFIPMLTRERYDCRIEKVYSALAPCYPAP